MLKNLPQMHIKLLHKKAIQKTAIATDYLILNKTDEKLQQYQKLHYKIIQKQMNKEYLEKDINLHMNNRKVLMI